MTPIADNFCWSLSADANKIASSITLTKETVNIITTIITASEILGNVLTVG